MTQLPGWILSEGKAVILAELDDVLEPIKTIVDKWQPIANRLLELGKQGAALGDPLKVVTFIFDNLDDAQVKTALDEIDAGLATKLVDAKSEFKKLGVDKLLRPTGELEEKYKSSSASDGRIYDSGTDEGLIRLKLPSISQTASTSVKKADLTLGVSSNAMVDIEAGSIWPFKSDEVKGRFLRMGVEGSIKGSAGAKLPIGAWASFGASASGSGEALLGYFYRPAPETTFVSAAVPALRYLANPFDLEELHTAAGLHKLEGFVMHIGGAAEAKAEVTLGEDFAIEGVGSVKVGLTASVNFARTSSWTLSLRKEGTGYSVIMSRLRKETDKWSIGASIEADVSTLAQKLDEALVEATEYVGPHIETIKPFLSPGTYALKELGDLTEKAVTELAGDTALAKAILTDIGLVMGKPAEESLAIESWLFEQLTAAIDGVEDGVLNDPAPYAKSVLDKLTERLPGIIPSKITSKARGEVDKLIGKILDDYKTAKNKLVKNQNLTAELAAELARAGITVKTTGKKADNALAGIRDLVEKYEKFSVDLRNKVKEAAARKIGATITSQYSRIDNEQYELIGTITEVNDGTKALWRELMLGRLQPLQEMLIDPANGPAGFIIDPESAITLTAESSKIFTVAINVFGLNYSFKSISKGKAKVVTKNGTVSVLATAKASRESDWLGTRRESNFISVYDLQDFKTSGESRALSLSIDLARKDENLESSELRKFLDDLMTGGLLSASRVSAAKDALDALRNGGKSKIPGDVAFSTALTPLQIHNLLVLGKHAEEGSAVHRAMFASALTALMRTRLGTRKDIAEAWEIADNKGKGEPIDYLYEHRLRLPKEGEKTGIGRRGWKLRDLQPYVDLASGLPDMFHRMHTVYTEMPQFGDAPGWDQDRYRREQQAIADAARGWMRLRTNSAFGVRLHPVMVTLLQLLAQLENAMDLSSRDSAAQGAQLLGNKPDVSKADPLIKLGLKLDGGKEVLF